MSKLAPLGQVARVRGDPVAHVDHRPHDGTRQRRAGREVRLRTTMAGEQPLALARVQVDLLPAQQKQRGGRPPERARHADDVAWARAVAVDEVTLAAGPSDD